MDKIYSRWRLKLPKIQISIFNKKYELYKNSKIKKILLKTIIILFIAFLVMFRMFDSVDSIINKQCQVQAKAIATRIANQQATIIMNKYKYEDLFEYTKDTRRKNFND